MAGEWVCPTIRAEGQHRSPTWGIQPLSYEKNEVASKNVRAPQGGGPRSSESTSHPTKMTCGLIRAKQASRRDGAWRAAVHGCLPSATTARLPPTSSAGAWSCLQLRQQPAVALVSAVAGCATTGDPDTRESQRLTPACRNAHLRGSTWPSAADLPSTRAVRHARHPLPPAIGVAFNLIGLEVQ